jgi:uracil-DNA glycosylase family 4
LPQFVGGYGPANAKLMIVGEAPGELEERHGIPFYPHAPSGEMLTRMLQELGVNRADTYITNVFKYRPPGNSLKLIGSVCDPEQQIELLFREIDKLRPNAILAVGGTALKFLTGKNGINKYRGSILSSLRHNTKVIPTIHPGNILNPRGRDGVGAEWRFIVKLDIKRAIEESLYPEFNLPKRHIAIAHTAKQLYDFFQQYRNINDWSLDIETNMCIPYCIGLAPNPYNAIVVPLFDLQDYQKTLGIPMHELANIWIELSTFLSQPRIKLIGQNFKFDHEKIIAPSRLIKWERGKLRADTSLMAGAAYPEFPKRLEFLTSIFTREPYYKDEGKEFNPKHDKIEQKLIYCGKDCTTTYEVYEALCRELRAQGTYDFYFNFVNRFHDLYMEMEAEGMNVDNELRASILKDYDKQILDEQALLESKIGHEINIDSPKQVSKLLYEELKLPTRENTQEDTLVALLGNNTKEGSLERYVLGAIMKLRQLDTNAGYLRAASDYDGKMRTSVRITGTETGRTSNSILKPPVRPTKVGLPFQTLPAHGPYSKVIRSIFITSPEDYLLAVDMRQAEARFTSHLADDQEAVREFDEIDVYKKAAALCMSIPIEDIDDDRRYVGKKLRLAFGYGIKKHRAMLDINSEAKKAGIAINVSEKEVDIYLKRLHAAYPKVQGVYHTEVMAICMRDRRTLTSPFGRKRTFFGNLKNEEVYANIPQSIPPDHIRSALFRMQDSPEWDGNLIRPVMEKHDAINFLVKRGDEDRFIPIIRREFERPIDFSKCSIPRGLIRIPCEIKIGTDYKKMTVVQ